MSSELLMFLDCSLQDIHTMQSCNHLLAIFSFNVNPIKMICSIPNTHSYTHACTHARQGPPVKKMGLWKAPQVLIVHLKRFQYVGERALRRYTSWALLTVHTHSHTHTLTHTHADYYTHNHTTYLTVIRIAFEPT